MNNLRKMRNDLALCMMVKNEEKCILRAIDSVKPIVDEIVVVDTGSNDRTIELAKSAGAQIIEYTWDNDYPKIRNLALKTASSRWILVLDADEMIESNELALIQELIQTEDVHGYMMIQKSYTNTRKYRGWVPCKSDDPEYGRYAGYISNPICRLFQNRPDIYFTNILHELVEPTILKFRGKIENSYVSILHYGHDYFGFKPDKWDNYIASGVKNIEADPLSARPHRDIGIAMIQAGRYEDAVKEFLKGMQKNPDTENLRYNLAVAYNQCGKRELALEHFDKVLKSDPCYIDARNNLACLLMEMKRYEEAFSVLIEIINKYPDMLFARFNFGVVLGELGRFSDALHQLLEVERLDPGFPELANLICDIYLASGLDAMQNRRESEAIVSFENILKRIPSHRKALIYLVKELVSIKKIQTAANVLEKYISHHCEDVELVNLHKHVSGIISIL